MRKLFNFLRYFIEFAYNGLAYHGWQVQPNASSVQQVLNRALSLVLDFDAQTTGAGRTDTGVHASQMFAHFDHEGISDPEYVVEKLNSFLPKDIAVKRIIPVHDTAHARFDAVKRIYNYYIHTSKNPFLNDLSWYQKRPLNVAEMNKAAAILLEHTDFECFSKVNTEVSTFNCAVTEARWEERGESLIFTIAADRFLRNMVRAIVGTLVNVGLDRLDIAGFEAVINSKDRKEAGISVPAHGLYLTTIEYEYITSPDGSGILL